MFGRILATMEQNDGQTERVATVGYAHRKPAQLVGVYRTYSIVAVIDILPNGNLIVSAVGYARERCVPMAG